MSERQICPECGKNPAGDNGYPCMDCWIDDPFERVDYEAYRSEQERRHWQTLDDQEHDAEVQQFIDENGDYPADHWAVGQNNIIPTDTTDTTERTTLDSIAAALAVDVGVTTDAGILEAVKALVAENARLRDMIGEDFQRTAELIEKKDELKKVAFNVLTEYDNHVNGTALKELAKLIGYPGH